MKIHANALPMCLPPEGPVRLLDRICKYEWLKKPQQDLGPPDIEGRPIEGKWRKFTAQAGSPHSSGLKVYSTRAMRAIYASEKEGEHLHPARGTPTWYMSPEQRDRFEVSFNKVGQAVYAQGGSVLPDSNRRTAFVMSKEGRIYARIKENVPGSGQIQHSSFLAGEDVASAGMLSIQDGKIRLIRARSGHYAPRDRELVNIDREIRARSKTGGQLLGQQYEVQWISEERRLLEAVRRAFRTLRRLCWAGW